MPPQGAIQQSPDLGELFLSDPLLFEQNLPQRARLAGGPQRARLAELIQIDQFQLHRQHAEEEIAIGIQDFLLRTSVESVSRSSSGILVAWP